MPSFDQVLESLTKTDLWEKIAAGFLGAVFLAAFFWLVKVTKGLGGVGQRGLLWLVHRVRDPLTVLFEAYREELDRELFRIQHAWMKEGQTLDDILVPVVVEADTLAGGIENWSTVLAQCFRLGTNESLAGPRRLAVIGGPGSGKSVALKVAAREAWDLPSRNGLTHLVPVLLTFADYRRAEFDLVRAVEDSFERRGFRPVADTSDSDASRSFVEGTLRSGKVLLIVDALDELEREDRKRAAERLTADLKRFSSAPAIFSCRRAAWTNQFAGITYDVIEMADFTPLAIRQFVRQWSFDPPKSSDELFQTIQSQPHIGDLGRTPLMLTIIAFLYAQPKYHLPENRAEFYDICSRALLEEWDQHKNPNLANRFERHHKEYVLGELAYRHLCGKTPDSDLDERATLVIIAEVMQRYSLKADEDLKMLTEIRENSGLLMRLPPSGLRFPHQTYLEFFAALHLLRLGDQSRLFQHYHDDPQRWREVMLLYIGLNTNADLCSQAVARLQEVAPLETTLHALADARAVKPEITEDILESCEKSLAKQADPELITVLGYVASNPRTAHSQQAADILKRLLESAAKSKERLPAPVLEALLMASLRRPKEEVTRFVVDHLDELELRRILPQIGERAFILSTKIIGDPELVEAKKLEWIDGLRRAGGVQPLLELLTRREIAPALHDAVAIALVRLSSSEEFKQRAANWTDGRNLGDDASDDAFQRWGWPFAEPVGEIAQRLMVHLASKLAAQPVSQTADNEALEDADRRVLYLASGLRREAGVPQVFCFGDEMPDTSPSCIRSIWKKAGSARWLNWMAARPFGWIFVLSLLGVAGLVIWGLVAILGSLVGWTDIGLGWPAGIAMLSVALGSGVVMWFGLHDMKGWSRVGVSCLVGLSCAPGFMYALPFFVRDSWRSKLNFSIGSCFWLMLTAVLAAFVSGDLAVRLVFGGVMGWQIIVMTYLVMPGARYPAVGNVVTERLCQFLTTDANKAE